MSVFRFGAVVLAAGASRRMGRPKQLLEVGGRTLLRRTVDAALASAAWPVVVVLGAHRDAIRPEVARLPVLIADNAAWEEGLSSSIRTGIRVLDAFSLSLDAGLLLLCDQPALSAAHLQRLAGVPLRPPTSIVASRYAGHLGPPALFGRVHFPELAALQGPAGARPVLERHAAAVAAVPLPELAADLDTPADLAAFLAAPHPASASLP